MVDKIEMSLDDIIKSNRNQKPKVGRGGARRGAPQRGGRRGGVSGTGDLSLRKVVGGGGGVLKGRNRGGGIQKAKFARGDVNSAWKHDMYDGPKRGSSTIGLSKLLVSNLDYGVSDSDIKELFNDFGPLKKAAVHYDRSGRSLGTADVVFERRSDALKAIKQYNGVPLDGRPMNIQMATSDVSALTRPNTRLGSGTAVVNRRPSGSSPIKRGGPPARRGSVKRGGKPGGRGGGRRERLAPLTAEELDAELDAYVNDMKI